MRKQLVAALLAAASLMPGIAAAQDADRQANREARGAQREARQQPRADRAPDANAQRQQPQREARQEGRRDQDRREPDQREPRQQVQRGTSPGGSQQQRPAVRQDRRADRGDVAVARNRQQDRQALQREEVQDRRLDQNGRGGGQWTDQRRGVGTYADRNGNWNNRNRYDDRYGWNGGWRGDNRYDWNRYRTQNRAAFRLPRYYAPYGWNNGYRRFAIGARLSQVLFSQNYWIDDPWSYRLPEADGPYRWVRYYNDALLVDLETGEVVDTIEGIFW